MAIELNNRVPPVPGPRGLKWQDTAIHGSRERRTGILNNETYVGRLIFNRRKFSKNPEKEQREARMNDERDWVVSEVAELRTSDELWAKVKQKQKQKQKQIEVEAQFKSHNDKSPQPDASSLLPSQRFARMCALRGVVCHHVQRSLRLHQWTEGPADRPPR